MSSASKWTSSSSSGFIFLFYFFFSSSYSSFFSLFWPFHFLLVSIQFFFSYLFDFLYFFVTFSIFILLPVILFLLFKINSSPYAFFFQSCPLFLFFFLIVCRIPLLSHSEKLLEYLSSFLQFPKSRWPSSVEVSLFSFIFFSLFFLYLSSPLYFIFSCLSYFLSSY